MLINVLIENKNDNTITDTASIHAILSNSDIFLKSVEKKVGKNSNCLKCFTSRKCKI